MISRRKYRKNHSHYHSSLSISLASSLRAYNGAITKTSPTSKLPTGSWVAKQSKITIKTSSILSPITTSLNALFKLLSSEALIPNVFNAKIPLQSLISSKKTVSLVQPGLNSTLELINVKKLKHQNQPVNAPQTTSGVILKINVSALMHSQSIWDANASNVLNLLFGMLLKELVN